MGIFLLTKRVHDQFAPMMNIAFVKFGYMQSQALLLLLHSWKIRITFKDNYQRNRKTPFFNRWRRLYSSRAVTFIFWQSHFFLTTDFAYMFPYLSSELKQKRDPTGSLSDMEKRCSFMNRPRLVYIPTFLGQPNPYRNQ